MTELQRKRQRMYFFVPYHLSGIQKGIQAGHAKDEFHIMMEEEKKTHEFFVAPNHDYLYPDYFSWLYRDKTYIVLDGGDSYGSKTSEERGSMQTYLGLLEQNGIAVAEFYEPQLNNTLTALAFLVDETVWDKEKYPDPVLLPEDIRNTTIELALEAQLINEYGTKTAFLRMFLKGKKLAI